MKFLRAIDIFQTDFKWAVNGKKKYSTTFGILLSIFTYTCTIAITFLFGKDIFLKNKPKIISQIMYPEENTQVVLNNNTFNFAFRIESENGKLFDYKDLLSIDIDYFIVNKEGKTINNEIGYISCNEEIFPDYNKILKNKEELNQWKCMNLNKFEIKEEQSSTAYSSIEESASAEGGESEIQKIYLETSAKGELIQYMNLRLYAKSGTKAEKVMKQQALQVNFIYPSIQYAPLDETPLKVNYIQHLTYLGVYLRNRHNDSNQL